MTSDPARTPADDLARLLSREIIHPRLVRRELEDYLQARVPAVPSFPTVEEWEAYAQRLREKILDRVVFRGAARAWRDEPLAVEWLDAIEGGPGYHIRTLRYQSVPGLWIPALLYQPDDLAGKVPVVLNVNGHEPTGKWTAYKQARCANLARRGMLALSPEWLGMGQLAIPNLLHYRMNQLDLCGTSGLAVFFLAMQRGLDLLLSLEHADPERTAVAGLSGGGWQTIVLSALDPRVQLANPVAGYTSYRVAVRYEDIGDSEQSPCDLGTLADHAHLTALRAPRPTLLTYNAYDNCCFQAYQALPAQLDAARPAFALHGKPHHLRWWVNYEPGTHNFDRENREQFYRLLGDHFFADDPGFDPTDLPCEDEIKSEEQLQVPLPEDNADFNTLALALSERLPRDPELPAGRAAAQAWQDERRGRLRQIARVHDDRLDAVHAGRQTMGDLQATFWWLRMERGWTVPGVELARGEPQDTAIVVADNGRASAAQAAGWLLERGYRVLAIDPYYLGESHRVDGDERSYLFALLLATLGDRPLGLQAGQLAAVARWLQAERELGPVVVLALGPVSSLFSLIAAGLEQQAIGGLELHGSLGSLREILEQNLSVDQRPEPFCFGLLEAFDILQIAALTAPRPVRFQQPGERVRRELEGLREWYQNLGERFDPLE